MAAYSATVTLDQPRPIRLAGGRGSNLAILTGTVTALNYNTALAAIAFTALFKSIKRVVADVSANGYTMKWNAASKAWNAYRYSHAITDSADGTAMKFNSGALTVSSGTGYVKMTSIQEGANDDAIGAFNFIVIGAV